MTRKTLETCFIWFYIKFQLELLKTMKLMTCRHARFNIKLRKKSRKLFFYDDVWVENRGVSCIGSLNILLCLKEIGHYYCFTVLLISDKNLEMKNHYRGRNFLFCVVNNLFLACRIVSLESFYLEIKEGW